MIRNVTPPAAESVDDECRPGFAGGSCSQVHLIEPYVGRELLARTQTQFELHLFSCEYCLRAVEFELLVMRALCDFARFAQFSRSWH